MENDEPAPSCVTLRVLYARIYLEIGRIDAIMRSHEIDYGDKYQVTRYRAGGWG